MHAMPRLTHRILITFCSIFCFSCGLVRAQENRFEADTVRVSLRETTRRAVEVSPEISASRSATRKAEALSRFAKANRFLTEFELTTAFSTSPALSNPNNTPTDRLYLDPDVRNDWDNTSLFSRIDIKALQPIFTWGELSGNIRAAAYGVEVQEETVRATSQTVLSRSAEMYYNLLLTTALFRITREAGNQLDEAVDKITELLDSGDEDVDEADLFDVQITRQEFRRGVIAVEQSMKTASAALARLMILPEGTVVRTAAPVLKTVEFELLSLDTYQSLALQYRPELGQLNAGRMARSELVTVAKSEYYPKLFLAADVTYSLARNRYRQRNPFVSDPFLSRSIRAGIGIRQKLNFSQTRARVERARFDEIILESQGEALYQLVLFEVEAAYRNVITAEAAVSANAEALRISKEWLRTEQVNFDLEIGDSQNLVRVVKRNLETTLGDYRSRFEYNAAVLKLLAATGTLEASLENGIFVE